MLLKNGQASKKGLVLQGANISEKDAPHHYMRAAVRGPQHCGHRFYPKFGLSGFQLDHFVVFFLYGVGHFFICFFFWKTTNRAQIIVWKIWRH